MYKWLVVLVFIPFSIFTQEESGRKTVEQLCSPEFHGRGYVNGGDSIAANHLIESFQSIGCEPFKQGVSQSFSFPVNTFPGRMQLSINEKELVPGTEFVVNPASCGGIAEKYSLISIQLNEILYSASLQMKMDSLSLRRDSTKQFVLVFYSFQYKGDTLKKVNQLVNKLNEKYGIVEIVDTKFTWSVAQNQTKYSRFEIQKSALPNEQIASISYTIDAKMLDHNARNIVVRVPSKKKSKKTIVFTAHYDHLGRMGQSTYFPGGNDNASGTAMLLELARYYAQHPIKKTNVVFIAFAGEEAGLLGSQFYVEHPYFPLSEIKFLFNTDIMGSGEEGITIVNATLFPQEFKILQAINTKHNYVSRIGSRGAAANSDHYYFSEKGVPAFFMYTQGPNKHYHDVYDTYNELSFNEFNDLFHLLIDFGNALSKK